MRLARVGLDSSEVRRLTSSIIAMWFLASELAGRVSYSRTSLRCSISQPRVLKVWQTARREIVANGGAGSQVVDGLAELTLFDRQVAKLLHFSLLATGGVCEMNGLPRVS